MAGVLIKEEIWTWTSPGGEHHVKMKVETGGCVYKPRKPEMVSKPSKPGEEWSTLSLTASEGPLHLRSLVSRAVRR